jgi:hypothetical protein
MKTPRMTNDKEKKKKTIMPTRIDKMTKKTVVTVLKGMFKTLGVIGWT